MLAQRAQRGRLVERIVVRTDQHAGDRPLHPGGFGGTGAHVAALDLGRRALQRLRIEGVAAEQPDFPELREQARARMAARDALELVEREVLVAIQPVGGEFVASAPRVGRSGRRSGRGRRRT